MKYDGIDTNVFEYLLEYRLFAAARHLLRHIGAKLSAQCVPMSSATKAAVYIAMRRCVTARLWWFDRLAYDTSI